MDATLSFLALGDSYTIGEGVPEMDRWTHQLAAALRAEGIPLSDPPSPPPAGPPTSSVQPSTAPCPPATTPWCRC
jgi:hypothetical protein